MEFSSFAGPTTGRSLVLFEEGAAEPGMAAVQEAVGPTIAGERRAGWHAGLRDARRGRRRRAARAGDAGRRQQRDPRRRARADRLRARDRRDAATPPTAHAAAARARRRPAPPRPRPSPPFMPVAAPPAGGAQRRLPARLPRRGAAPHRGAARRAPRPRARPRSPRPTRRRRPGACRRCALARVGVLGRRRAPSPCSTPGSTSRIPTSPGARAGAALVRGGRAPRRTATATARTASARRWAR